MYTTGLKPWNSIDFVFLQDLSMIRVNILLNDSEGSECPVSGELVIASRLITVELTFMGVSNLALYGFEKALFKGTDR